MADRSGGKGRGRRGRRKERALSFYGGGERGARDECVRGPGEEGAEHAQKGGVEEEKGS